MADESNTGLFQLKMMAADTCKKRQSSSQPHSSHSIMSGTTLMADNSSIAQLQFETMAAAVFRKMTNIIATKLYTFHQSQGPTP